MNRRIFKWLGEYEKMLRLANKRGRTWAVKHRSRFYWLKRRYEKIVNLYNK